MHSKRKLVNGRRKTLVLEVGGAKRSLKPSGALYRISIKSLPINGKNLIDIQRRTPEALLNDPVIVS
jgi:hypothetical protein